MRYGYGRVSSIAQDTALQLDAFDAAGVADVVTEKWSSVGTRPKLMKLLSELGPGDEFVVWKLDRVGRSLLDLLSIHDRIMATGASLQSITEHIDTRTPAGKLMFSVLGAFAEFERSIIRERAIAGQVAAYKRGVRWGGGTRTLSRHDHEEIFRLRNTGLFTIPVLADMHGVSVSTIDRVLARRRHPAKYAKKRLPVLRQFLPGHFTNEVK